jgi:hypothetical protein
MIRIDEYEDRIEVEEGRIVRTVNASWNERRAFGAGDIDVYRMSDDGKESVKCLYFSKIGGYMVDTRDDAGTWWEPIISLGAFRNYYTGMMTEADRELIVSVYPEFRYTLKKAGQIRRATAMKLLIGWKKNPKIELLVGAGLNRLVFNGNFARMTNESQKRVLSFIREHDEARTWTLNKIQFVMAGKGTAEEYESWNDFRDRDGKAVEFKWFKKYGTDRTKLDFYRDYIGIARECGHDVKEEYWKWPSDIKKAHEKVMKENDLILEARRLEERKAKTRREKEKKKIFSKLQEAFAKAKIRKSKMCVFVPDSIKSVREQANRLHQCLMSCDYIGKMAERRCVLAFITDNSGNPIATAEILPNGKIGQFYGDERGHDFQAMKPGKKATEALMTWLKKYENNLKKFMAKKEAA